MTTLAAALGINDTVMAVSPALDVGNYLAPYTIDSEAILVTGGDNTASVSISRGQNGTARAAHALGATVTEGWGGGGSQTLAQTLALGNDADGNTITNLAPGVDPSDVATVGQLGGGAPHTFVVTVADIAAVWDAGNGVAAVPIGEVGDTRAFLGCYELANTFDNECVLDGISAYVPAAASNDVYNDGSTVAHIPDAATVDVNRAQLGWGLVTDNVTVLMPLPDKQCYAMYFALPTTGESTIAVIRFA